jgi:hypothetical protein
MLNYLTGNAKEKNPAADYLALSRLRLWMRASCRRKFNIKHEVEASDAHYQ